MFFCSFFSPFFRSALQDSNDWTSARFTFISQAERCETRLMGEEAGGGRGWGELSTRGHVGKLATFIVEAHELQRLLMNALSWGFQSSRKRSDHDRACSYIQGVYNMKETISRMWNTST